MAHRVAMAHQLCFTSRRSNDQWLGPSDSMVRSCVLRTVFRRITVCRWSRVLPVAGSSQLADP